MQTEHGWIQKEGRIDKNISLVEDVRETQKLDREQLHRLMERNIGQTRRGVTQSALQQLIGIEKLQGPKENIVQLRQKQRFSKQKLHSTASQNTAQTFMQRKMFGTQGLETVSP